ncbi:GH1 family beta-glucosidase [Dyella silvatica]|uniref:GH1 family beta-glucosidase n=1 Tax=Dyella silvatica TaxID=2992128 RepID=UPI002257658D|nr:GH1 family beta-glucosidase [Dyella silvatica]
MSEPIPLPRFPPDFLWGVSTSAYQIEGALQEDGRGRSVWDTFCDEPGRIAGGDTAETACDHYRRYPEDVALMAGLGIDVYRFSIAWPRIQPLGRGAINSKGLDFYSRLVDTLLAKGISPVPTLFHWDLPQALQDAGGWFKRDTADRFAEYARVVAEHLGDRVPRWITHNETFEHTALGHALGTHAPGLQRGLNIFAVVHHLLLSHGKAVQALRATLPASAQIGIAQSMSRARPASGRIKDRLAAYLLEILHLRMHTDPLLLGRYPRALRLLGIDTSALIAGDMQTIAQPLDFLGINFYNPQYVRGGRGELPIEEAEPPAHFERTAMGWPVDASGFDALLLHVRKRYGSKLPPIVITENGAAFPDTLDAQGRVDDPRRIAYLHEHLQALRRAMDAGVDVRGYFVWSLLDNFEWAEGFRPRFGLVHVDYATQKRTPKASFDWYRRLIAASR